MKLPTMGRRGESLSAANNNRLTHALAFALRGWYVFPCTWVSGGACSCGDTGCEKVGKHPLTRHGFKHATVEPATIREWWTRDPLANIGIATGPSNLVVLDIDPRKGGNESLAEWKPLLDAISTYVVRTGRDGLHYYFDRGHASVKTRISMRPGIDVIADTGYVMAAGSTGLMRPYVCERDTALAAVPFWLLEAVQRRTTVQREGDPSDVWVEVALAGVAEGQRNDTATSLAGYYLGKKVPANVVLKQMLDWAGKCTPPMDEGEVRTVVASVDAMEHASSTAELVEVGETLTSCIERIKTQPPRPMLIQNLVSAESITLLHGQPRAGKSLALLEISLALSTGRYPFGLPSLRVPAVVAVLYITEEDPEVEMCKRLERLVAGNGLSQAPEGLFLSVRKGLSIDDPQWQNSIIETVKQRGIRVVVIDPLRSVTAHADQGPAELVPVVQYLRRLMRETGCAILLGHHDTKLPIRGHDTREAPHRISGGGLFALADTPIHVRRLSDKPLRSVLTPSHCKFFSDPPSVTYTLHEGEQGWVLKGEHKCAEAADEVERREEATIVRYVTENPGASSSAIEKGINRRREATFDRLDRLAESGKIENRSRGRKRSWHVVPLIDGSGGSP